VSPHDGIDSARLKGHCPRKRRVTVAVRITATASAVVLPAEGVSHIVKKAKAFMTVGHDCGTLG
jgi:hypothetical protein